MFRKIVVGIDGSDTSKNAVRVACDLAQHYDAEVHLLHTPQPDNVAFALGGVAGYHMVATMPSSKDLKDAAEQILTTVTRLPRTLVCRLRKITFVTASPTTKLWTAHLKPVPI